MIVFVEPKQTENCNQMIQSSPMLTSFKKQWVYPPPPFLFTQWHPEVRHFCGETPVILIGCKTDLRKDKEGTRRLKALNLAPVTYIQVMKTVSEAVTTTRKHKKKKKTYSNNVCLQV